MPKFFQVNRWTKKAQKIPLYAKDSTVSVAKRISAWHERIELKVGKFFVWTFYSLVILAVIPFWYLYWDRTNMPDVNTFLNGSPTIGQVYDANGEVVVELAKEYRTIVPFEKIPPHVKNAILAAEDTRFFNYWLNHGIDYIAISRAVFVNGAHTVLASITKKRGFDFVAAEGASTITQQVVRLYFLSGITQKENNNQLIFNNWLTRLLANIFEKKEVNKFSRKIIEWKYSIWLESKMADIYGSRAEAKRQIFIRFTPYLGNGRYGFESASMYYFNKHIWEIVPGEVDKAALLAGMIKNPALFTPRSNQKPEQEKIQIDRRNTILNRMAESNFISRGYISNRERDLLKQKPIEIASRNSSKTIAPSVVNDILKEIRESGFESEDIFLGNIQIRSTVNLKIQKIVNDSLEAGLEAYEKRHPNQKGLIQGSVVVLRNDDGAILGMAGGREFFQGRRYKYSDLNRVKRARQAGSSFKPFIYLTAFRKENGWSPDRILLDSPVGIPMGYGRGNHYIHNYDGKFLGAITACEALYRSRNAAAVRLTMSLGQGYFEDSGMKKIIDTSRLIGIKSPYHSAVDHKGRRIYYPTSALGASEMTVLEIANAYRAIASGLSAEPYMIKEITDRDGKVLFTKKNKNQPLEIDKEALEMTQSCLRKVVTRPGGTAYSLTAQKFPIPVMGKTGTTNDFRNALFAGSTYGPKGITVVARVDFDDNRQLAPKETGALAALPIFREIIRKVYEEKLVSPVPSFPDEIENWIDNKTP